MVKNTPAIFWQKALKFETVVIVIKYAILSKSAEIYVLLLLLLRYSNVFFCKKRNIWRQACQSVCINSHWKVLVLAINQLVRQSEAILLQDFSCKI